MPLYRSQSSARRIPPPEPVALSREILERIERRPDLQPAQTLGLIVSFIEGRYTLPE